MSAMLVLGSAILLSTIEPMNVHAAVRHTTSSEPNGAGTYGNPVYIGKYRANGACSDVVEWTGQTASVNAVMYWCVNPYVASWAMQVNEYVLYSWDDQGVAGSSEYYISRVDVSSRSFWYVWMRYGKDIPAAS
jgi:hypothetical protein